MTTRSRDSYDGGRSREEWGQADRVGADSDWLRRAVRFVRRRLTEIVRHV